MTALIGEEACRLVLQAEVKRLPDTLRSAWLLARARMTFTQAERIQMKDRFYLKHPKPPGRWAKATALMVIAPVNQALDAKLALGSSTRDITDLADPQVMVALLEGPLQHLGGPTKFILVRAVKTFIERILSIPCTSLDIIMLRIRSNELARDYTGLLKEYGEYRRAALSLEPNMLPDEPHDLTSAIMARTKAIATMTVSIDPRLGEFSGLRIKNVIIDGSNASVVIPAELSKERVVQERALDAECALPVIEYVERARPFLNGLRLIDTDESDALWLTCTGTPLIQAGVKQALSRDLANAVGAPVGAKILRKAMASRDVAEAQLGAALGHSLSSLLAINLYGDRHAGRARREVVAMWNSIDFDSGCSD